MFGMDMLNSFLHPEEGYKAAERPINQGFDQAKQYQTPYWKSGVDQIGKLTGAQDRLLNPDDLQNEWSKGYQESPFARDMLERNKSSGLDAASSMGLMGSSAALNNIQTGAGQIMNSDRQQYMNDLMQKYLAGIGIGQHMFGTGAGVGSNLGEQGMRRGENLSGLEYGRVNAPGDLYGRLLAKGAQMYSGGVGA